MITMGVGGGGLGLGSGLGHLGTSYDPELEPG